MPFQNSPCIFLFFRMQSLEEKDWIPLQIAIPYSNHVCVQSVRRNIVEVHTVPALAVSLDESDTCCTASWAACTETTQCCFVKSILENIPVSLSYVSVFTCSFRDPFDCGVAAAFQALKGFLQRGHGSTPGPCGVHCMGLSRLQSAPLFNTLGLSQTLVSLHVPVGLIRTKPPERGLVRLASWQLYQEPSQQILNILSRLIRASKKDNPGLVTELI